MTASEQAKSMGLKSLAVVAEMTKKPTQTLNNWHNDEPELFEIVLLGCVNKKSVCSFKSISLSGSGLFGDTVRIVGINDDGSLSVNEYKFDNNLWENPPEITAGFCGTHGEYAELNGIRYKFDEDQWKINDCHDSCEGEHF